jgi:hypothetical protein
MAPLDTVGRQYADKLFHQSLENILKTQREELVAVRQDFAARNMARSGPYFTSQVQVYVRNAELLAQARVDSVLRAYEKSGVPLDSMAFAEISREAAQFSEQQGRNIVQVVTNQIGQTFGGTAPNGFRETISGQILRELSGVSARIARNLSIMRDEAELAARTASTPQTAAQATLASSGTTVGSEKSTGNPPIPPKEFLQPRPRLYYWRFCQKFGEECYRTWRAELLASLIVSLLTYFILKGDDPLAGRNFKIALLATVLTLAGFALWHLVRTPWLVHREVSAEETPATRWSFGIFGIAVLIGLIAGAFVLVGYLGAVPSPPVVRIVAPPPPTSPAQVQEKPKQNETTLSPSSVQPDRVLNSQRSDHLYRKLKEFAANPKNADLISVTIAPYAYQDVESSRLSSQLARVLEDAHWKVLRQTQLPIKLEGRVQHQIPVGIWILTSGDQGYGYFLWSSLNDVGLNSQVRPKSDTPSDFNGTIIWVGYKEAPIY